MRKRSRHVLCVYGSILLIMLWIVSTKIHLQTVEEAWKKSKRMAAGRIPGADESTKSGMDTSLARLPKSTKVPKIVHFVWCPEHFQFNNYLSLMSAVKFLDPDRVMFHYENLPTADTFNYDTWFQDARDHLPSLHLAKIHQTGVCKDVLRKYEFISEVLHDEGGVYQEESVLWLRNMTEIFDWDLTISLARDRTGYVVSEPGEITHEMVQANTLPVCPSSYTANVNTSETNCFSIRKRVYPKDFWGRGDAVSLAVNRVMYDSDVTPVARRHVTEVIPNIAHMLWLKGREVDYLFYLSCLSLLYVAKVDWLYVHGDMEPRGEHWDNVKAQPRVKFIQIPLPNVVFNNVIRQRHHMSDVFRADVMMKYGGIYSDVDVIWTQPIDRELLHYDAVAALDWAHAFYPFPDYINLGASLGRPGATFWVKFRRSMKEFRDDQFGYNGLLRPYKIYEHHPGSLYLRNDLQVMCYKTNCYPRIPGKNESSVIWDRDTFAYHWTWPTPPEFLNKSTLLAAKTKWADIGKNVLRKAGIL